jgi:solute:Na+ symporter, SSS family
VEFGFWNYVILFVYLALMFYIGVKLSGKQETTDDLFLAKRSMPWILVGMSMFASMTSAISYMGIPGRAFEENASLVIGGVLSVIIAPVLILLFYPFYRKLHVTTSYEFVGMRYGPAGRYATSVLFLLARFGWLGTAVYAPSVALSVTCGVPLTWSILLMGVVSIAYTTIGGLAAVIWTDSAQYVLMLAGAVWVAISLCFQMSGDSHSMIVGAKTIFAYAGQHGHGVSLDWHFNWYQMTALAVLIGTFFSMMQDYGTDQVTVQRLLAAKDNKGVAKAVIFNGFTDLTVTSLLVFVGLGMFAYYNINQIHLPANIVEKADRVFPYFIMHGLPVGVSGLLVVAIYAAAMSSISAGTNSVVTVLMNDLMKPFRKKDHVTDEAKDLKLGRTLTIVVGVLTVGVAFLAGQMDSLLKASQFFLGLFAAPILSLFILGMLSRRGHFWGWIVGVAFSVAGTLILQDTSDITGLRALMHMKAEPMHWLWIFPVSFGIAVVVGYIASVIIPAPLARHELTVWGMHLLKQHDKDGEVVTKDEPTDTTK